jgi:hypothetical protein
MYSSRRFSVRRHIDNKHSGEGKAIPYIEYLIGRRDGEYTLNHKPEFGNSSINLTKMMKEAERVMINRVIEQCVPPAGDPSYAEQAKLLRLLLTRYGLKEAIKLLKQNLSDVEN